VGILRYFVGGNLLRRSSIRDGVFQGDGVESLAVAGFERRGGWVDDRV